MSLPSRASEPRRNGSDEGHHQGHQGATLLAGLSMLLAMLSLGAGSVERVKR
jgi:hypothetical protein